MGVVAFLAMPYVVVPSRAEAIGIPTFQGSVVADFGQVLVFTGTIGWGGVYTPISDGDHVYSDVITLVIYDLRSTAITMPLVLTEAGESYNSTTTITPGNPDVVTISLQQSTSWNAVSLKLVDKTLHYQVATPLSLLPPSIANVGGMDLLVLAVLSEALIAFAACVALAKYMMMRALWAPKFSLLIWGHVVLVGLAGAILVDFQWVDQTFAGWSPLIYVGGVAPMFFASILSYFNEAPTALILRPNAPLSGTLSYHGWHILTAKDPRGRTVIIQPSWGGFWARFWGHHVTLADAEYGVTQPEPFVAVVDNRRVLSKEEILKRMRDSEGRESRFLGSLRRRVARPTPRKQNPLDDFVIHPAWLDGKPRHNRTLPIRLYWTSTGQPVEVEWPRLSFHKVVERPAKLSPEGQVLIEKHTETRLTWPHYTEGRASIVLNSIHYRSAQSVVAGWRQVEDLAKVLSMTSLDLEMLKSAFETGVQEKVREIITARSATIGRTADDMDETEAAQEAERPRDNLRNIDDLFGRGPVMPKDLDSRESLRRDKPGKRRGKP